MSTNMQLLGKLELALLLQLIGLVIVVIADSYLQKKQKRILLLIALLAFSLLVRDRWDSILTERPDRLLRTLLGIYGYGIRPVILVLYLKTLEMNRSRKLLWCLVAANAAIYFAALFTGISFRITEENLFAMGPLGYIGHVLCAGLLAMLVYESVKKSLQRNATGSFILLLDAGLLVLATVWDWLQGGSGPVSWLTVVVVSSCLFYYLWLHMQSAFAHEQALEAEQRIQIMMSQIQPHFLFNTLSTIQALCRIDPEKASETTEKFGTYLRMNIDSISQSSLIPFRKELEHTRIYADIEMMRFPYIHISYDIKEDDFELPALSIQPMVENAIRHGVRGRYNGSVKIMTRGEENEIVISVIDNGKGFDPEGTAEAGGMHIGIRNVRERIEVLCGGTLEIESEPGKGSTVTIRLPRRKEKE
jgi:signal transduction histidine kinase